MWLLFAIFIFIIVFFFIKRAEHKKEQDNNPNKHSHAEAMQTHSVVTDVIHEEQSLPLGDAKALNHSEMNKPQETSFEQITENQEIDIKEKVSSFLAELSSLKIQFEMTFEWRLFNSDAALLWHKDNPIITILCLSHFKKGEATNLNYKDYHFNIESWSWYGPSPKGAATEIKKQLIKQFRSNA